MTNVMSSQRGWYDAVISGVIGPGQRGGSGGGHAKRGLRPQGAPAPQRGHSPASGTRRVPLSQAMHPVHPRARKTPRSETAKLRRQPVTRSGGSVLKAPVSIVVGAPRRGHCPRRRLPVTRSGGSVLKAPQRRRGGTPPRAETGAYRHPYPCILKHEKPRVFSPHGEKDTGSSAKRLSEWA